ncbi:FUSC family membrane protein [Catalinimonas sp. 4WD22]|uniref:FUSC family protein n=1 Tax=Catalinimonas locisalis TaxID=3133978 RepID=UPI0031017CE7
MQKVSKLKIHNPIAFAHSFFNRNDRHHYTQQLKSFFFGQYLATGLKITLGILLPSLIFAWFDELTYGLIISLGALYVSISDQPGPVLHRRNGMLVTNISIFTIALITGMINQHTWLIAIEIPLFCFAFSMLMVYGSRAAAVGTATLLMMISSMHFDSGYIVGYAFLILSGGIWYMLLSLSLSRIRPYRLAQQYLGECILEVARYIRLKAEFYDDKFAVNELYKKLIVQQIVVNEQQDNVRQIGFRTRKKVKETMRSGRLVIMIFTDIIEAFELAMSSQIDYSLLRQRFIEHQILPAYRSLLVTMAKEFDDLGYALINNEKPRPLVNFDSHLNIIKERLLALESEGISVRILKKTLVNIRNMTRLLSDMYNYFQTEKLTFLSKTEESDLTKFVSHQDFDLKIFKDNISLRSTAFRHSIRLTFGCFLGYIISLWLPYGQHSYWILITILVILKPDFSISKKRNYERVLGTVAGGFTGAIILLLIQNEVAKLILLVIFMILAFSFNKIRYVLSVTFMTALILILFSFIYKTSNLEVTSERIVYTLIGSAIAFLVSYFVLPSWESSQIKNNLINILKANLIYLQKIIARSSDKSFPITDYRLARQDVYMQTANMGSAFQRMLHEPKNKQERAPYINEFVVLNHILSSYLAALSSSLEENHVKKVINTEHLKLIRKSKFLLQEAIKHIDQKPFNIDFELPDITEETDCDNSDAQFIQKQLELIRKVSSDLEKLSQNLSKLPN